MADTGYDRDTGLRQICYLQTGCKEINASLKTASRKLVRIGNSVFDWKLVHSLVRLTGNLIFFANTNPKQIAVLYGDDCCAILCPVNAPAEGKLTIESLLEEDL